MTEDEKRICHRITVDCWRLLLKYQNPVAADEFWQRLNDEAGQLAKQYCETDFVKQHVKAALNKIDEIWERQKIKELVDN